MRIIYSIGAKFAGHGIGSIAYNAVKEIDRRGYLKTLIVTSYRETEINSHRIKTVPLAECVGDLAARIPFLRKIPRSTYLLKDNIFDLIASTKIDPCDIFHGWGHHSLFQMKKAKRLGAITVIERASSHPMTQTNLLREEYERYGPRNTPVDEWVNQKSLKEFEEADYIAVPSKFVYDSFIEQGCDGHKLFLIPFGVDIDKFKPRDKQDDVFRVLFVGEIGLRKGVQYLLETWSQLKLRNAELVLVGGLTGDIQKIVKKYQQKINCVITGHLADPTPFFSNASVFAFPSVEDGFALVVLEAMASGVPVIVSENTGAKDVVTNGEDGFVIPIRDAESLAEKILYFYDNKNVTDEMGRIARQKAESCTWQHYRDLLIRVYEYIIARGERPCGHRMERHDEE